MAKEWLEYSYEKNIAWHEKDPIFKWAFKWKIKYEPLWHNSTQLYNEIDRVRKKKHWPVMSWSTHVKYLREMVKEHSLIESRSKHNRYNQTFYRLSEGKLQAYLRYLYLSEFSSRFRTQTRFGNKPYAPLLLSKLDVQLIRIIRSISSQH